MATLRTPQVEREGSRDESSRAIGAGTREPTALAPTEGGGSGRGGRKPEDPEVKRRLNRESWARTRAAKGIEPRQITLPAVWDEAVLTERWEERKARLAKERTNG